MVKTESITAEIFLVCTNDARTNVEWTTVNLIVGICSRCSLVATFKISSKIGFVTAEIFLIWTNVARTIVALTNVIVTVG